MNDRLRRHRKALALLAGLAVAATISVVAPATASAATPSTHSGTGTVRVVDHPAKGSLGSGGSKHTDDWVW